MTIQEALNSKLFSSDAIGKRVNSWALYGEEVVMLFYPNLDFTTESLEKLGAYKALANKLVLVFDANASDEQITKALHLELVDALSKHNSLEDFLNEPISAKLAFEGSTIDQSKIQKDRIISL